MGSFHIEGDRVGFHLDHFTCRVIKAMPRYKNNQTFCLFVLEEAKIKIEEHYFWRNFLNAMWGSCFWRRKKVPRAYRRRGGQGIQGIDWEDQLED